MYSAQKDSFPHAPDPQDVNVNTYGFVVDVDSSPNMMEAYSPSLSAYETAPETPICSPLFFSPTSGFLELPQTPRMNGADAFALDIMLLQPNARPAYEAPAAEVHPSLKPVQPSMDSADRSLLTTSGDEARSTYESLRKVPSEIDLIEDETRHLNLPGMLHNFKFPCDRLSDNGPSTSFVQPKSEPTKADSPPSP